jgi:hypothetical protein
LQEILICIVLAESLGALARLPIEAHQQAMDILLEWIKDEQSLASSDGLAPVPPGDKVLDKTGQGAEQ